MAIDPTRIAVFAFDSTTSRIMGYGQPASVTDEDLAEVESILLGLLADYNAEQEKLYERMSRQYPQEPFDKDHFVINLNRYYRQYVPFLNEQDEKEVWVNCFCRESNSDWRKHIVYVLDGGNCYFQLRVNLTKGSCCEFYVNGNA